MQIEGQEEEKVERQSANFGGKYTMKELTCLLGVCRLHILHHLGNGP